MEQEVSVVKEQEVIQDEVINNLLFAHKRMAEHIDHRGVEKFLVLTKFILKKASTLGNKAVYIFPKHQG